MHRNVRIVLPFLTAFQLAFAAPYIPDSDASVLERLPVRPADPRMSEINELRRALRQDPANPDAAVALARRYYELVAAEGDPRYVGYAQAALAHWWAQAEPPVPVRVMRAILRQFSHDFDAAVADLSAAVRSDPSQAQAWAWLAAIHMVQADYARARQACDGLRPHTTPLLATTCTAYVDSVTGRAAAAAGAIRAALAREPEADPAERLWVLTRLAEIEERRGDLAAAERAFRAGIALGEADVYLYAAYADFLLDQGRHREVIELLRDKARADVLLLRLAIASKQAGLPARAEYERDLAARFEAARLRGDSTHRKEEARFVLEVRGDAARAVPLAQENFAQQKEPADARILLEAALASGKTEAAAPVLQWMDRSRIESVVLHRLAQPARAAR